MKTHHYYWAATRAHYSTWLLFCIHSLHPVSTCMRNRPAFLAAGCTHRGLGWWWLGGRWHCSVSPPIGWCSPGNLGSRGSSPNMPFFYCTMVIGIKAHPRLIRMSNKKVSGKCNQVPLRFPRCISNPAPHIHIRILALRIYTCKLAHCSESICPFLSTF